MEYGIKFGERQIDKEVKSLDHAMTISEGINKIEYILHKKEMDTRNYSGTQRYHPTHVFHSVVFSQMVRVIERKEFTRSHVYRRLRTNNIRSDEVWTQETIIGTQRTLGYAKGKRK